MKQAPLKQSCWITKDQKLKKGHKVQETVAFQFATDPKTKGFQPETNTLGNLIFIG